MAPEMTEPLPGMEMMMLLEAVLEVMVDL